MKKQYFTNVFNSRQRLKLHRLVVLYVISEAFFMNWWFSHPLQNSERLGYVVTTLSLAYIHFTVWYYLYFLSRMKKINPRLKQQKFKTALITTRVPSAEPFDITIKTLKAMLKQNYLYRYDVWLADEDPSKEVLKWCKDHGVRVSSRKDSPEYHQEAWPRRRRCKEGNLAYFYDKFGYDNYDIVFQFDADHVPKKNYVNVAIKAYNNEKIGYVAAPSICVSNAHTSWSARGRLYVESSMHGAYQLGLNDGYIPFCIGSHYSIRTKALKEIGGIGPELAEDFSTSFLMNVHGWEGAFAHMAIASGDGPQTFADCMKQEFQWSRSLVNLLLTIVPSKLSKLSLPKKLQVIYALTWYPMTVLTTLLAYVLPLAAIVLNNPIVNINYFEYIFLSTLQLFIILGLVTWVRNQRLFRPSDSKVMSWEGMFYLLSSWPYILWGLINSVFDTYTKQSIDFKITPKTKDSKSILRITQITPYIILAIIPSVLVVIMDNQTHAAGYYYLTILTGVFYFALLCAIIINQHKESTEPRREVISKLVSLAGVGAIVIVGLVSSYPQIHTLVSHTLGLIQ